jgi:SAM-dependent methyltransferase
VDDAADFFDEFARVYDARDGAAPDDEAVEFYRSLARDAPGPALEVGVGTGGLYLALLADGLDVTGVDVSEGMLDRLRERATARGLDPEVRVADATTLDPRREYGLVYVPDRVFNHVVDLDAQRAALARLRDALAPGGRLALNSFVPDFETVANYGDPTVETVRVDGDEYEVARSARLVDRTEQVSSYRVAIRRDGETVAERETPLALVSKREFRLLFDDAGFSETTVYGGFDRSPLDETSREQVWVAER